MPKILPELIKVFALQHAWRIKRPKAEIVGHSVLGQAEYFVYMHDPKALDYGLIVTHKGVMKELDQDEARRMIKRLGTAS